MTKCDMDMMHNITREDGRQLKKKHLAKKTFKDYRQQTTPLMTVDRQNKNI